MTGGIDEVDSSRRGRCAVEDHPTQETQASRGAWVLRYRPASSGACSRVARVCSCRRPPARIRKLKPSRHLRDKAPAMEAPSRTWQTPGLQLDSAGQWSSGRVVDCCRLESDRAFAGPVGSNPTCSAIFLLRTLRNVP